MRIDIGASSATAGYFEACQHDDETDHFVADADGACEEVELDGGAVWESTWAGTRRVQMHWLATMTIR